MTFSRPPEGVERAFHRLVTVVPPSSTTIPQDVVAAVLLRFLTVTFAQYPLPHCDWIVSVASIMPSGLVTPDSREPLSSSAPGSTAHASRLHANERETTPRKRFVRMIPSSVC
ncbi:uncharacterized protein SOCE836_089950 [Sorangium cellulosum]|uniref:Uncharacterized protein n=1 Tax=Sorangium cellulosum TaxID=56 RepID=A0A4P2R1H8_SORCE|nr:uncharacterized protein SOCE836_089950 [Sorangium cellulosum]WCQ96078.1 hypothetical protein NQZ70_08861 [Sorangium sp. Soce836]